MALGGVKRVMAGGLSSQNPCCNVTWVDPNSFGFKGIPEFIKEREP
jgi:hypothetical protein